MKKNFVIGLLILSLLIGSVSAECTDYEIALFSDCYGMTWWDMEYLTWCRQYDIFPELRPDGVINLSDVAIFAQECAEDDISSGKSKMMPIKKYSLPTTKNYDYYFNKIVSEQHG